MYMTTGCSSCGYGAQGDILPSTSTLFIFGVVGYLIWREMSSESKERVRTGARRHGKALKAAYHSYRSSL